MYKIKVNQAEPTLQDVINLVNTKFDGLDGKFTEKFDGLSKTLEEHMADSKQTHEDILSAVNTSFTAVTVEIQEVKQKVDRIESRVNHIQSKVNILPTKDYLDEKMSQQSGTLISLIRKADHKVVTLVQELHDTKVISNQSSKRILALEPFPQIQH